MQQVCLFQDQICQPSGCPFYFLVLHVLKGNSYPKSDKGMPKIESVVVRVACFYKWFPRLPKTFCPTESSYHMTVHRKVSDHQGAQARDSAFSFFLVLITMHREHCIGVQRFLGIPPLSLENFWVFQKETAWKHETKPGDTQSPRKAARDTGEVRVLVSACMGDLVHAPPCLTPPSAPKDPRGHPTGEQLCRV